jgi:DNA-directed RNA polymerase specialized sigma24 family protein
MSKLRHSPSWGFAPVVCTESRTHRISVPEDTPQDVVRVQSAYERLLGYSPPLALVLLAQYHTHGAQSEKAEILGIRVNRYRERLSGARAAMLILLSA